MRLNNQLNQHLLVDNNTIRNLVAEIKGCDDIIIEIGPGTGNITKELLNKTNRLTVIEKDKDFAEKLSIKYGDRITVVNEDFLKYKIPEGSILVGNIPFNITEPLIEKMIRNNILFAVFVVGNKFAESVETNDSKLSLLVNSFFSMQVLQAINKKLFSPVPRTNAKLIKLTPKISKDIKLMIFRELFVQRDKILRNSLREALVRVLKITKNEAKEYVVSMKISESILDSNIENLNNKEIIKIYHSLSKFIQNP